MDKPKDPEKEAKVESSPKSTKAVESEADDGYTTTPKYPHSDDEDLFKFPLIKEELARIEGGGVGVVVPAPELPQGDENISAGVRPDSPKEKKDPGTACGNPKAELPWRSQGSAHSSTYTPKRKAPRRGGKFFELPKKIWESKERAHAKLKTTISNPTELPRPPLHPWHPSTPNAIFERLCSHFKDHCVDVVANTVVVHKDYKCSITCSTTSVHWKWVATPTGVFARLSDGKQTCINDPVWSVPIMTCKLCKKRIDLTGERCLAGYGITYTSASWVMK